MWLSCNGLSAEEAQTDLLGSRVALSRTCATNRGLDFSNPKQTVVRLERTKRVPSGPRGGPIISAGPPNYLSPLTGRRLEGWLDWATLRKCGCRSDRGRRGGEDERCARDQRLALRVDAVAKLKTEENCKDSLLWARTSALMRHQNDWMSVTLHFPTIHSFNYQ